MGRKTPRLESLQTRRARMTTRSKMLAETEFSSRSKMSTTRNSPRLESLQTRRARRTTRSKMSAETEFSSRSKMLKRRKARVLEEVSDIGKEKARVQGGLSVSKPSRNG